MADKKIAEQYHLKVMLFNYLHIKAEEWAKLPQEDQNWLLREMLVEYIK